MTLKLLSTSLLRFMCVKKYFLSGENTSKDLSYPVEAIMEDTSQGMPSNTHFQMYFYLGVHGVTLLDTRKNDLIGA